MHSVVVWGKTCHLCTIIIEASQFQFKNLKTLFYIKTTLDCNSKNVIYVLFCEDCGDEYIGQTINLRNRVIVHRQQAKNNSNFIPASKHFNNCAKKLPYFKVIPFYQCKEECLKVKEAFFIDKLRPQLNALC